MNIPELKKEIEQIVRPPGAYWFVGNSNSVKWTRVFYDRIQSSVFFADIWDEIFLSLEEVLDEP